MSFLQKFVRFCFVLCVLPTAWIASAIAQSSLTYDLETTGQFDANFRTIQAFGVGTAGQTTVTNNSLYRLDVTSGTASTVLLFDQTTADTTIGTQSSFATTGDITVALHTRAVTTNSSISVLFLDPSSNTNNLIAVFNLIAGADSVRFFRDGTLISGNVGTQVGTTNSQTTATEPNTGTFTTLTVTLSVSGTTPTITVTPQGGTPVVSTFAAGDFNFTSAKTTIALRVNDAGNTAANTPIDVDNIVITSPTAPDNAPPPPEANVAPTLPAQADRSVAVLDVLQVNNAATDTNTPAQTLTYQLTEAPVGASISSNGLITWSPTAQQVSATAYAFTTVVTDSGTPQLTATNTFQVTVTNAPVFEYSQSLDFTNSTDFASNFRILTDIGGGTLGASGGNFVLDARSNGGNTSGVLIYDITPNDTTNATQTAFPTSQQVRVSFLARAATTGSIFTASFADPRNANNRVSASFIIRAGEDTVRFHRDGELTATSSSAGTQVGEDVNFDAGVEPGSGFVFVKAILTVSGTTPTITITAGSGSPVTSAFVAGDIDWNPTLVLLRLADPSPNLGPLEIDNLLVAGGTPVIPAPPVLPPAPGADGNLITINPSFESGSLNNFSGSYSFSGWTGTNALFSSHAINTGSIAAGTTTNGVKYLRQSWGGTLTTAVTARPPAVPGITYELTYDQRSLIRNFPNEKLGCTPTIEFFDEVGVRIKSAWNFAGRYRIQHTGINTYETFNVRAVAPPGTAYMGLFFNNPAGRFVSSGAGDFTQDRHVEMDHIRLKIAPDLIDRVAYRRAPRLVEPGQVAQLKINHITTAVRTLRVALVDSNNLECAVNSIYVPKGNVRATPINLSIPQNLPNGTYSWKIELRPQGSNVAVTTLKIPNVLIDQNVVSPTLNATDFRADHPYVHYLGRIEELPNGSRWWNWYGSEVRLRFSGTSLSYLGGITGNGFGGFTPNNIIAVIDEDFANPISVVNPLSNNFTKTIVSNLPDGIHTARLYKTNESDLRVRFDAFRVDAGRGLLRPEPLSARRLEVYGDSVTSGSSASPSFNGYAPLLGRELDTDVRVISKGGTGVAASFSGLALLVDYYNNLVFTNAFNASAGAKYDLTQWIPDVVFCAIGHNDQFNGGGGTNFNTRYAEYKGNIRTAYPNAQFISANTLISNSLGHFQNAVDPLIAADPKHVFVYQPNTWNDSNSAHPPTDGHAAMVFGDERRASFAEVVEDRAGWGVATPLTGYEQWAVTEFTQAERNAGVHAPGYDVVGDGVSNLMKYALGIPSHASAAGDLPEATVNGSNQLTLSFMRAKSDVTYVIETSDDLDNWVPSSVNPGTVGSMVTFTDASAPPNATKRFARLVVY